MQGALSSHHLTYAHTALLRRYTMHTWYIHHVLYLLVSRTSYNVRHHLPLLHEYIRLIKLYSAIYGVYKGINKSKNIINPHSTPD